jgi:predicted MFS family arabinose efflux permease
LQQLESDERGHILREIGEGVTLVARHPLLRSLIVTFGLFILGAHVVEGVEVPFAYRSLHLSPLTFGVVLLCGGIGAVCGALLARPAVRYVGLGRSLAIGNLVAGFMFLVIPLGLILPPPGVLIAAYTMLGAANTVANINQFTLRQVITPGRLQGRMSATFRTVYWGAWPLGNVLGGLGGAIFGTAQTILAGGALAVAASLAILATPLAELRIFPDADQ